MNWKLFFFVPVYVCMCECVCVSVYERETEWARARVCMCAYMCGTYHSHIQTHESIHRVNFVNLRKDKKFLKYLFPFTHRPRLNLFVYFDETSGTKGQRKEAWEEALANLQCLAWGCIPYPRGDGNKGGLHQPGELTMLTKMFSER